MQTVKSEHHQVEAVWLVSRQILPQFVSDCRSAWSVRWQLCHPCLIDSPCQCTVRVNLNGQQTIMLTTCHPDYPALHKITWFLVFSTRGNLYIETHRQIHPSIRLYLLKNFNMTQCKWHKNRAGRKGHLTLIFAHDYKQNISNDMIQNQKNQHYISFVETKSDRDVKLTVGGRLFHGFITRSVKKILIR